MHEIILFMARYAILVACLATAVYWLTLPRSDKRRSLAFGLIAGLITLLLVTIAGLIFIDPRPFTVAGVVPIYAYPADNGFPSDHTALALVLAATVGFISKRMGLIWLVAALAIGTARVVGNLHRPIDIVGSLVCAGLAVALAYYLMPMITRRWLS